jgi:2,3-dimethylmalate lyase
MIPTLTKRAVLAKRIRERDLVIAPGVFDMISTLVASQQSHPALYMTGYGTVASYLGLPDAGLASFSDMVLRAGQMANASDTPLIADADTGFGGLLNVQHTIRGFETAGVAAIQIEDQQFPKKCGHTVGRLVIPKDEMVQKVKVACAARSDPNFLIVARTDARTANGLEDAIERALAYRDAGADVLFVESPESEEEFSAVAAAIDAPLLANMVEGGRSPLITRARLAELGYALAIYPATGMLATATALDSAYRHIAEQGTSMGSEVPLYPIVDMHKLMGFEQVWDFEARWGE